MPSQNKGLLSGQFNCIQCGQCCHFFEMLVNPQNLKLNGLYVNEAFKKEFDIKFDKIDQCSIKVNTICNHLDRTIGKCKIYDTRPEICRNHFCQRYPKIEDEI